MGGLKSKSKMETASKTSNLPLIQNKTHIILLGDSVLDNFYWLNEKTEDLAYQLTDQLKRGNTQSICTNLALDETESADIINGKTPSTVYASERKRLGMEPYKVNSDKKFYPLEQLKFILNDEDNSNPEHAVLSIGGNDCRVKLAIGNAELIHKQLQGDNFEEIYRNTVKEIIKLIPNLIIVICYLPGKTFYSMFPQLENEVKKLAQLIAPVILKIAREEKLPVIDLSRTFNTNDKSHYGTTPIEPSNKSSMFICEHILDVIDQFQFGKEESQIFYGLDYEKKKEKNVENYNYEL